MRVPLSLSVFFLRFSCFLLIMLLVGHAAAPAFARQTDTKYPFRTDFANQTLPWYQLKIGEFPPYHSDHRVGGELVETDVIHRSGVFRMNNTGELVSFTMPPFGSIYYLNAEADLRDVPLGTYFLFFLYQDEKGIFNRIATMQDEYTMTANHGFSYRLDELKLEVTLNGSLSGEGKAGDGKLLVTRHSISKKEPDAAQREILVTERTKVWKGEKQIKLSDLAAGDELLFNCSGSSGRARRLCTEIWVGAATHKLVTEQQRKRHNAFIKARGVPAWIDHVEGDKLTVTLFSSEPATLQALFKEEGIDPAVWAKEHRRIAVAVATEHLRTYNPGVNNRGAIVQELQSAPTDCYGCSGVRLVIQPELMLEGFRKGRIVRLFPGSWPINEMPFGEGLNAGGHDEEPADAHDLQPADFPYRTDFGNENLPWYQLQPGKFPPDHSEHRVGGELVKVDAGHRSGQFRMDLTGELVDFTLPPFGSVHYLNADAELEDLPIGMRCLFFLYQDERGASSSKGAANKENIFNRAGVIMDEYSYLASNTLTYRLEESQLDEGKLVVVRHAAPVQVDYVLEPRVPLDFGRIELEVDAKTRVWKGDSQVKLNDLAVGDELLVNIAARTSTSRGRCTDIWVGATTHKLVTEQQRFRHAAFVKERGGWGWIDSVEGNEIAVTFFAGSRAEFAAILGADPYGKNVRVTLADEQRNTQGGRVDTMGFKAHLPEGDTTSTYGCSGIRWLLGSDKLPEGYRKGRIIRLSKDDWLIKSLPSENKPENKKVP